MGRSATNFFRHGELPLVLLALIAEQPRHAYQLLARLEQLFAPAYEPSTGSVYPAVGALVDNGLVASKPSGRRRVYAITSKGRRMLERSSSALAELERRTQVRLTTDDIDHVIARFVAAVKARPDIDVELLEDELKLVIEKVVNQ